VEAVERFKEENYDLVIADTSGGHKQEEDALFDEMRQVSVFFVYALYAFDTAYFQKPINSDIFSLQKPDLIVLVIDGNIGHDAFDDDGHNQTIAFTQSVDIGAVIVTKMDGRALDGGFLSA